MQWESSKSGTVKKKQSFLNIHLSYSFNSIVVCHHSSVRDIPPPSRGIAGKNRVPGVKTLCFILVSV